MFATYWPQTKRDREEPKPKGLLGIGGSLVVSVLSFKSTIQVPLLLPSTVFLLDVARKNVNKHKRGLPKLAHYSKPNELLSPTFSPHFLFAQFKLWVNTKYYFQFCDDELPRKMMQSGPTRISIYYR